VIARRFQKWWWFAGGVEVGVFFLSLVLLVVQPVLVGPALGGDPRLSFGAVGPACAPHAPDPAVPDRSPAVHRRHVIDVPQYGRPPAGIIRPTKTMQLTTASGKLAT